ncbi:MAG: deoxyribodipyrimidine photolyase [Candidatus Eisenbacteria bacterium]|nr:deoxyribodipyrimidine photolyase [Candidatus Eisenbacteria bacterium]
MQQSQRPRWNHALTYAAREADRLGLPVVAVFGITRRFPEARRRHYLFMLDGLRETAEALAERGIPLVVRGAPPPDAALGLADDAALVVTDVGYLRVQRSWRARVASRAPARVVAVESDAVVPIRTASSKEEYAARTIRPRIHEHLDRFLQPLEETTPSRDALDMAFDGLPLDDPPALAEELGLPTRVGGRSRFRGGPTEARERLKAFIHHGLRGYDDGRSDPGVEQVSHLSPYLHFGQISPVEIALGVESARGTKREDKEAFLEELIVRRELSMNFCWYNDDYDSFDCLPDWAAGTLAAHAGDERDTVYSERDFERGETHDTYWNAAQREMLATGKMHPYMRMYWGKKIIEWTRSPERAFEIAVMLNNRYELDGRDPNSFAGVAWCFGKHDRPWKERAVFGQIRWMSAAGLERKFDMPAYLKRVDELEDEERERAAER